MIKLVIGENEADQRFDRFLKKYIKRASLSMIYRIIRKDAKINGKRAKIDTVLQEGDEVSLYMKDEDLQSLREPVKKRKVKVQFRTVYEDENILVVDKPRGLLTHGDAHEKKNTLVNQVCGYLQEKGEYDPSKERTFAPAPVNRLDRNTTGLVIFGKNAETLREFTRYLRERDHVSKYYLTIVSGCFRDEMTIKGRLSRNMKTNTSSVEEDASRGVEAETIVRPYLSTGRYSVVEVELVTGRTHQIRTHLSDAGFPLAGDPKYGDAALNRRLKQRLGLTTQLLHAYRLEFANMDGRFGYLNGMTLKAGLPDEFSRAARSLDLDISRRKGVQKR